LVNSKFLAKVKHLFGIDRAIAYTVMAKLWLATTGIVTVILIARFLTPKEQGYYYTFYSLVALQVVFELGFSFVILQLAAHERAQLSFLPDGRIEGNPIAHSRLASVLQKTIRWYFVAGLLMALTLLPAGFYFFSFHQTLGTIVAWQAPWCLLVFSTMLAFQIDPIFSFLEGCGFVTQVAHRRFAQAVAGSILAWTALVTHHGLYSVALVILGQVIVGIAFLVFSRHRPLLKNLLNYPVGEHFVGWRQEIWPFQWRIAISWMCGYFIFQLFSPVLFAFQGPVAAGQMGMSLNIATGIGSVALAWMSTKASPFGAMVSNGQFADLDRQFFRTLRQSTILLAAAATAFLIVLLIAGHIIPKFVMRVLPLWAFALLLIHTIMTHIIGCQAIYLRAHKREPFLNITIISAILIGCSTFLLGKYFGANAIVIALFIQGIIFSLPSATYIFVTKRREWHNARAGVAS
jgi:hypothetical protein